MLQIISDYLSKNPIEALGAILTILCVWLNTKANIWGWFVGIISTICYIYVAYAAQLWGFCLLNIFFLAISLYGLWNWKYSKQGESKGENIENIDNKNIILPITKTTTKTIIILLVIGVILSLIFNEILSKTGNPAPFFDAIIFAFSIVAQGLLANKKIENWIFWILLNIATVLMFYSLQYWISAVLYAILFVLAIKGYYEWKTKLVHLPLGK
jgi:nicotinamide mononucleotide transporter